MLRIASQTTRQIGLIFLWTVIGGRGVFFKHIFSRATPCPSVPYDYYRCYKLLIIIIIISLVFIYYYKYYYCQLLLSIIIIIIISLEFIYSLVTYFFTFFGLFLRMFIIIYPENLMMEGNIYLSISSSYILNT